MAIFEIIDGRKLRKKVRVIIVDERGQFLLIQPYGYEDDAWTLVGGGVEEGENDWQAVLREIHEETGIKAVMALHMSTIRHSFHFSDSIKSRRKLDHDGQIASVFFAVVTAGQLIKAQVEEIKAYCWATWEEIDTLMKVPEQRSLFKEVVLEFAQSSNLQYACTP
jgi:8-oxo-dGTP pyrophosphatase MutT (NUDIX family)